MCRDSFLLTLGLLLKNMLRSGIAGARKRSRRDEAMPRPRFGVDQVDGYEFDELVAVSAGTPAK
jgi:hypothetical protein